MIFWLFQNCIIGSQLRTMSCFFFYLWKYICKAVLAPSGLKMCGFFLFVDTPFYVCTTKKNHFGKHVSDEISACNASCNTFPLTKGRVLINTHFYPHFVDKRLTPIALPYLKNLVYLSTDNQIFINFCWLIGIRNFTYFSSTWYLKLNGCRKAIKVDQNITCIDLKASLGRCTC